jgi:erythromycin esterase-like protein
MNPAPSRIANRLVRALILAIAIASPTAFAASNTAPDRQTSELDRLLADVCKRQTVLIGEDGHHGSGATLSLKVDLVRHLIDECGFNAVYFESSVYDFIDFQHQIDQGTASPEMLADAIGGLWSVTGETAPLIAYLFAKAKSDKVSLAGLDLQFGSATSVYTRKRLPHELSLFLDEPLRKECEFAIKRLGNWGYDSDQQYLDARGRLDECAIAIEKRIAAQAPSDQTRTASIMVKNLRGHLTLSSGDSLNKRDQAMYENFLWHRSHRPDRNKIIVWCATVHAAKDLSILGKDRRSLGSYIHALQKEKAAAIGFTALKGSYGRNPDAPDQLAPAATDSIERRALSGAHGDLVYLNARQLKAFGVSSARPLDYAKPTDAQWSDVVDGLVVLREEHPPHIVRSMRPQQAVPET